MILCIVVVIFGVLSLVVVWLVFFGLGFGWKEGGVFGRLRGLKLMRCLC